MKRALAPGFFAAAVLSGAALLCGGCDNDCDFFQRCNGDVREVCGDGPDQAVHRRIHHYPCDAPNDACVERDEDHAECVLAGRTTCDDRTPRHCEGDVLILCDSLVGYTDASSEPPQYLVADDCAANHRTCVEAGDDASCVESND